MSNTITAQATPWDAGRFQVFEPHPNAEVIELEYADLSPRGHRLVVKQTDLHGQRVGSAVFFERGIWGCFTQWDKDTWQPEYNRGNECVRLVRLPQPAESLRSDSTRSLSYWSAE